MGNDSGAPQQDSTIGKDLKDKENIITPVLIQMENGFSIKTVPMLRIC